MWSYLWGHHSAHYTALPREKEKQKGVFCFLLSGAHPWIWAYLLHSVAFSSQYYLVSATEKKIGNLEAHSKQENIHKCSFLVFFSWASLIDSVRLYFQFRPDNTPNSSLASRVKNSFTVLTSKKLIKLVFILPGPLPCTKKARQVFPTNFFAELI